MLESIRIEVLGKKYDILKNTTLEEVAKVFQEQFSYPILLARYNGKLVELNEVVDKPGKLEFFDLTIREGNRAHISGIVYMMIYAVKELYGKDKNVTVQHSIDKGLYVKTNFDITEENVSEIKNRMQELTRSDLAITRVDIDRLEASKYFESIGDNSKMGVIKYNTNSTITLYRLGSLYNYFYGLMPVSTKYLKDFDLTHIDKNGFVLRFPTIFITDKIKEYTHHPHMFEVFKTSREWAHIMNIENSVDLNTIVSHGNINDIIRINETLQSNRLLKIAEQINSKKDKVKIILIAGPSSSGKTTTTRKLCMYLKSFGITTKMLSMDDYFVERENTPLNEKGKPDYECLEAMDLDLFDEQVASLLNGEEVLIPTYNFIAGAKEFKNKIKLKDNDILLIEGIHALDDNILKNISRENKYKIYISALTQINMDDHNRFSTTDNRLLRRIIRDNRTRGHNVEHTLQAWPLVREGEEKYIFPFQDDADFTFNSALIYEIGVLKTYVEPLLYSVEPDSIYYEEAKRLINYLRLFLPIPSEAIPEDSILREFIGGSCFHD